MICYEQKSYFKIVFNKFSAANLNMNLNFLLPDWRESNGFVKDPAKKETDTKKSEENPRKPVKYFNFDRENLSYPIIGLLFVLGK